MIIRDPVWQKIREHSSEKDQLKTRNFRDLEKPDCEKPFRTKLYARQARWSTTTASTSHCAEDRRYDGAGEPPNRRRQPVG
jgi:hypothetical protein